MKESRWQQRFENYLKALERFKAAITLSKERELSELEKQGLIQSFEFTHELAWKVMRDFIKGKGEEQLYGSKDATRKAFKLELIEDGDHWMEMIESRNLSSHTYDQNRADKIILRIEDDYAKCFLKFEAKMKTLL
jgi:nucleotidyltransferase substrate binding protein (TIGR01987 family)